MLVNIVENTQWWTVYACDVCVAEDAYVEIIRKPHNVYDVTFHDTVTDPNHYKLYYVMINGLSYRVHLPTNPITGDFSLLYMSYVDFAKYLAVGKNELEL